MPIQKISRETHLVTLRKLERGEDESDGGHEGHKVERVKTGPVEGTKPAKLKGVTMSPVEGVSRESDTQVKTGVVATTGHDTGRSR